MKGIAINVSLWKFSWKVKKALLTLPFLERMVSAFVHQPFSEGGDTGIK